MSVSNTVILVLALVLIIVAVGGNAFLLMNSAHQATGRVTTGRVSLVILTTIDDTTINLYENALAYGQNWFSIPYIMQNTSVTYTLDSLGHSVGTEHELYLGWPGCTGNATDNYYGNYTIIWTYNTSDIADPWKSFNPAKPCLSIDSEDLQKITHLKTYQITVNQTTTLEINGSVVFNSTLELIPGPNWMGYPSTNSRNVSEALGSLGHSVGTEHELYAGWPGCTGNATDNYYGNYTIIWTYDASDVADPWKSFNPSKPCLSIGSEELQMMNPTAGYQIMMNNTQNLIIDW